MMSVRFTEPLLESLLTLVFSRYPRQEWATFVRFGWRETADGLALVLAAIDEPRAGDLDRSVPHVSFQEPYSVRVALAAADEHELAIGVVHSHPKDYQPPPSRIDDDMDSYYADYLAGFAPDRPYVSLIFAENAGVIVMTGRVHRKGAWHTITQVFSESRPIHLWRWDCRLPADQRPPERIARLGSLFGSEAACRLLTSTVAVIGAGGTGSAAIEALARAGVGRLVLIDPDTLSESNLERVHGSVPGHVEMSRAKVLIARDHVRSITSECEVIAIQGSLPQEMALDAVLGADVIIGCTDQQHSRVAMSEIACKHGVPAIDCGVALEGQQGQVTGQIMQLTWFRPAGPCAYCRGMVDAGRIAQELMSEQEKARRRADAQAARERGQKGNAYWQEVPQLLTVGYLTTAAGALAAGYAIGLITRRFAPPFSRVQLNMGGTFIDLAEPKDHPLPTCNCRRLLLQGDRANQFTFLTAPTHWPAARNLSDASGEPTVSTTSGPV